MVKLRAHYQNAVADESLWEASLSVYWDEFEDRDQDALRKAFAKAWKEFPDWMPSAGQFRQLVDAIEKSSGGPAPPDRLLEEEPHMSGAEARARIREIVKNLTTTMEIDGDDSPPMEDTHRSPVDGRFTDGCGGE